LWPNPYIRTQPRLSQLHTIDQPPATNRARSTGIIQVPQSADVAQLKRLFCYASNNLLLPALQVRYCARVCSVRCVCVGGCELRAAVVESFGSALNVDDDQQRLSNPIAPIHYPRSARLGAPHLPRHAAVRHG